MGTKGTDFTITIFPSFAPFPYPIVFLCLAPKQNPKLTFVIQKIKASDCCDCQHAPSAWSCWEFPLHPPSPVATAPGHLPSCPVPLQCCDATGHVPLQPVAVLLSAIIPLEVFNLNLTVFRGQKPPSVPLGGEKPVHV